MCELMYKGQVIEQRESDGYVNLSQMAKIHSCKINDWSSNKTTKEYIDALAQETGIPANKLLVTITEGFPAVKTTWGHPLLAIAFAQWISADFHVWSNVHIKTLMETGVTTIKPLTATEALLLSVQQLVEVERKQRELEEVQQRQGVVIAQQQKEIEVLTAELAALKAIINQPIPTCPQTLRQKLVETVQLLARVFVQKGVCATYPEANKEVWTRLLTKIKFSPARRDIPLLKHNKEKKYQEDLLKYEQDRAAGLKTKKPLKKDYFLNSPEWIQHLNLEQLAYTCLMSVVKDAFTLLAV